jgi:glycosyltransferase involved in cell wall biosynthesis
MDQKNIAVLIPCYNESLSIAKVITDFKAVLPQAIVYVYDNNSTDETAEIAKKNGAIVRLETRQGKGNVVKRMFRDIDADLYVMVDGDATYDPNSCNKMIDHLVSNNLDMLVGVRKSTDQNSYRSGHKFGNWLFTTMVEKIFGKSFTDILSGYRVFTKRFVKSFPCLSNGFEIETELTVHALDLQLPVGEIETPYFARLEGSNSKLSTYKDGFKVLKMIFILVKEVKPFYFFGINFLLLNLISILLMMPIISNFLQTGLVPKFPTLIVAVGFSILGFLSLFSGIILDSVSRGRKEAKILKYLG